VRGRDSQKSKRRSPSDRSRQGRERPLGKRAAASRVQWHGFRPLFDYWGNEIKRFYKLETLASATEGMLRGNDRFVVPSVRDVLGPAPVTSLSFDLFQEGKYQLVFRLRAGNAKRKQASFGFVVAKAEGTHSKVAAVEHANLRLLNRRAPDLVVQPFRGGYIHLPDRLGRSGQGRNVYAYVTQWLSGFHELGVDRSLQFFVNTEKPHLFTVGQTEGLKGRMVEIIARSYDARTGKCMDIPQVASGDFVVTKPRQGIPRLKLVACRRMLQRMRPAKILDRILGASWDWGGREFRLAPSDPATLDDALTHALGRADAHTWIHDYRSAVESGTVPEPEALPLDILRR